MISLQVTPTFVSILSETGRDRSTHRAFHTLMYTYTEIMKQRCTFLALSILSPINTISPLTERERAGAPPLHNSQIKLHGCLGMQSYTVVTLELPGMGANHSPSSLISVASLCSPGLVLINTLTHRSACTYTPLALITLALITLGSAMFLGFKIYSYPFARGRRVGGGGTQPTILRTGRSSPAPSPASGTLLSTAACSECICYGIHYNSAHRDVSLC